MSADLDQGRIEDIIESEHEIYPPPDVIAETAHVGPEEYHEIRKQATEDPVSFWGARAEELLDWYEPWDQVLDDSDAPFFKWFTGAKTSSR